MSQLAWVIHFRNGFPGATAMYCWSFPELISEAATSLSH
uniref:Uncharacterized protein n=1 Tax=Physcomitrium patens TaxID=3218 RepID=A0A2K1IMA6_PHYPA|nr:hypothetical protein PHYPA_026719 [Physcomitrium patens]